MKRIIFVLAIGFICLNQSEAKKINVAGYFITKSSDTVKVTFQILINYEGMINYEMLQWKIKYYDSANEKHILKPDMANEISFEYKGERIRMLSRKNNLRLKGPTFTNKSNVFLHLMKDGKLKLFRHYITFESNSHDSYASQGHLVSFEGSSDATETYIMQKDNNELFKTGWLYFKRNMVSYLADCPDLARKIEDKIYQKDDIEKIVDEYNINCH